MFYLLREYTIPLMLALTLHHAAAWSLYQGWSPDKETLNMIKPRTVMANLIMLEPKAPPSRPPNRFSAEQRNPKRNPNRIERRRNVKPLRRPRAKPGRPPRKKRVKKHRKSNNARNASRA